MSGWLIFPSGNPVAVARQEELKAARMAKVWAPLGGVPPGETKWPDGVTTEAVPVINHPSNGQAAVFNGPEAEAELTTGEQAQLRDNDFMDSTGWFG